MKKITTLCFLILLNMLVKAQESVVFKIEYLPKYDYKTTIKMDVETSSSAPKNKRVPNTPASKMAMSMMTSGISEMKTDVIMPDGNLPFTVRIIDETVKMNINGKELPIPKKPIANRATYGKVNTEGKIHIDSIAGTKVNEQLTAAMTNMINKFQGQMKFPGKAMRVGDVFTRETPLNIPGTNAGEINTTNTYKLMGIKNNKAYFDIHVTMNGDMNMNNTTLMNGKVKTQPKELTMGGSGSGKLIFDIGKNYAESKNVVLNMKMGSTTDKGKAIGANMKMTMDLKNQISPQ